MRTWLPTAMALLLATGAQAQAPAVHRTTLQEQQFPARYHTVTVRTVIDSGGGVAPHTHPGAEMGYILSGAATLSVSREPARDLVAGDSFSIPREIVHALKNAGNGPLTVLSTYVVRRDQPLATPVSPHCGSGPSLRAAAIKKIDPAR